MISLIPALPRFQAQFPALVDVLSTLAPPLAGDRYDVLVTRDLSVVGAEQWKIADEELVAVGAPARCRQWAKQAPSDWPLLTANSRPDVLPYWLQAQALPAADVCVIAGMQHYFLAISAAIAGMGVLIVPRLLVTESLRLGHLAELPQPPVRGAAHYCAFVNPHSAVPDLAYAFCRWLKRDIAAGQL